MPWTKLDDGLAFHPKIIRAGNELTGVFCRCLSYCGKYMTDGKIEAAIALSIAGSQEKLDEAVAQDLLRELPGGDYHIADYLDYNPPRDVVEAEREKRNDRAKRAARARWDKQR